MPDPGVSSGSSSGGSGHAGASRVASPMASKSFFMHMHRHKRTCRRAAEATTPQQQRKKQQLIPSSQKTPKAAKAKPMAKETRTSKPKAKPNKGLRRRPSRGQRSRRMRTMTSRRMSRWSRRSRRRMRGRIFLYENDGEAAAAAAIKFVFCAIHCCDAPVVNFVSLTQISTGLTAQGYG